MFDYRYHALSLAAVLLALAVGIVIGVAIGDSNLVSSAKNGIVANLNSEVSGARRQVGQLQDELAEEEAFAERSVPACGPWSAEWAQHRPGVPRRLLRPGQRATCARPSPRPAAT